MRRSGHPYGARWALAIKYRYRFDPTPVPIVEQAAAPAAR